MHLTFRFARRVAAAFLLSGVLSLGACSRVQEAAPFSATGTALIEPGESFTEGRLAAIQRAEKQARDQILLHVMDRKFPNGVTLEEAVVTDPFIQAKVYDTIRTSRITDQTVADDGVVTVTVQLDLNPLLEILNNPEYGGAPVAAKP